MATSHRTISTKKKICYLNIKFRISNMIYIHLSSSLIHFLFLHTYFKKYITHVKQKPYVSLKERKTAYVTTGGIWYAK